MGSVKKHYILLFILTSFASSVWGQSALSPESRKLLDGFEAGAREYMKQRGRVKSSLPRLPVKATPEQIAAHETALLKLMQAERRGKSRGSIFTTEAAALLKQIIADEFKDRDMREIRANAIAAAAGIPIAVNAAYPESREVLEMPPSLLARLPQLPPELAFRFAGRTLLLMDRGNRMIIDYLPNALP